MAEDTKQQTKSESSFSFFQLCVLAASSVLLCLLPLISTEVKQEHQVVAAAGLMVAAAASRFTLEVFHKNPEFACRCGFFAAISLLVAVASLLSSSIISFCGG